MHCRVVSLIAALLLLAACSTHSGVYSPNCLAHEGDTIVLAESRYEWRRFSDQIIIGDDGNPVDTASKFPQHGDYSISEDSVKFVADNSAEISHRTLMRADGDVFLLTRDEFSAMKSTGEVPDCALRKE